jgi:hypothetical protein
VFLRPIESSSAKYLLTLALAALLRRQRLTATASLLICCAGLLHGCAVNDIGLVRARHYENDSTLMIDLQAWGAHLLTIPGDAGLTLGYSRRKYLFRRDGGAATVRFSTVVEHPSAGVMHAAACDPCPSLGSLGEPFFSAKQVTGLTLDTNANRVGLNLGVRQTAILVLPADGSEVVLIKYSNHDDAALRAIVSKEVD